MPSLVAFASKEPNQNSKCRICPLDARLVKQVADGFAGGIPATTIARWLSDEVGDRYSPAAVRNHCRDHS